MPLNPQVSAAAKNAMLDALTALFDAGGAGTIKIYTGAQPAGPGTAIGAQVLLATLTLSADSFPAASGGVATAAAITPGTAVADGAATWYRVSSGAGTAVHDGSVGTSSADLILGTVAITTGLVVPCSSFTLTHP